MTDGIIKGTGNSRYLKSVPDILSRFPTWESAAAALAAGTFPIDLNGINAAGWQTQGTALNKSNLLTDTLCTNLGLATTATPTEAMNKLRTMVGGKGNVEVVSYTGTGKYGESNPNSITFSFAPKVAIVVNILNRNNDLYSCPFGDQTDCQAVVLSTLTTSYKSRVGLCGSNGMGTRYSKKSSDGKTIYWYNTKDSTAQYNYNSGTFAYTYYVLGIG